MGVFIVVVLIGISFGVYLAHQGTPVATQGTSYVIPDVPYVNIINGFRFSDTAAAMFSILKYWGDTSTDLIALSNAYPNGGIYYTTTTPDRIGPYFDGKGLNTLRVQLKTIDDMRKYINKDAKVPLLVFQKPSISISSYIFGFRARVVIGLDDIKKTVIVHDYWLGNNFEISYSDFLTLSATFMAVFPKQQTNIDRVHVEYPQISDNERKMLESNMIYYFNYYTTTTATSTLSSSMLNKIFKTGFLDNPDFQNMPPAFKMTAYDSQGRMLLKVKDYDGAIEAFTEAASYDHDLDKPFGKWPAVLITNSGQSIYPYYFLGETYMAESRTALAQKNFEKVLSINSLAKIPQTAP
jgi:hypothetical protein